MTGNETKTELKKGKALLMSLIAMVILVVANIFSQLLGSILIYLGDTGVLPLQIAAAAGYIISGISYIAAAYLLCVFFFEKLMKAGKLSDMRITRFSIRPVWAFTAAVLPVCVTIGYVLLGGELSYGTFPVTLYDRTYTASEAVFNGIFMAGLGAGIVEEMIFRGVIMSSLEKSFGRAFAVIVPSVLFGAVHILGMGFDPVSSIQTVIAGTAVGVMFSLAAIDGGSIWNSAIIHVLWNIVMIGNIFVVDVKPDPSSLITFVQRTDNIIITGGEFGRESGIIAIIGYIAVTAAAAYTMHRQSGEPPQVGEPPRA
ncbi:MAG: CPBP family intramembrane metalloprotease [Oscillospiraceae bacterium]|nr:CPBP family intramembrane metalloprotease [Oscillospiraceae bacterium]